MNEIKCSFLFFILFFQFVSLYKIKRLENDNYNDNYGEELDNVIEVFNKSESLYKTKHINYFSKYYEKAEDKEITMNTANLMKTDEKSTKSFRKLNAIANNVLNGDTKLKENGPLKSTLKIMLNDNSMNIKYRVYAAKLAARLNDIPVTIQITNKNPNNKPINIDSHVIVPRINRLYRPDYYVENYKAGNWDA